MDNSETEKDLMGTVHRRTLIARMEDVATEIGYQSLNSGYDALITVLTETVETEVSRQMEKFQIYNNDRFKSLEVNLNKLIDLVNEKLESDSEIETIQPDDMDLFYSLLDLLHNNLDSLDKDIIVASVDKLQEVDLDKNYYESELYIVLPDTDISNDEEDVQTFVGLRENLSSLVYDFIEENNKLVNIIESEEYDQITKIEDELNITAISLKELK